jgi:hypothetical protein
MESRAAAYANVGVNDSVVAQRLWTAKGLNRSRGRDGFVLGPGDG